MSKQNPIAQRSRQALIGALLVLMEEKRYEQISVTEITDRAQLSRRTFYRLFRSKEEVLRYSFLKLCESYVRRFRKGRQYSFCEIAEQYVSFWEEHLDFLQLLQRNHLFYYLLEEFNQLLPVLHKLVWGEQDFYETSLERQIALQANAGALWNILPNWLGLCPRPLSKEMATMLEKAMKSSL